MLSPQTVHNIPTDSRTQPTATRVLGRKLSLIICLEFAPHGILQTAGSWSAEGTPLRAVPTKALNACHSTHGTRRISLDAYHSAHGTQHLALSARLAGTCLAQPDASHAAVVVPD